MKPRSARMRRKSDLKADMTAFRKANWEELAHGARGLRPLASHGTESQGRQAKMPHISAIGLMSGTSMDGIDLALLRTDGENSVERGPSFFVPYEASFRRRVETGLEEAKSIVRR